MAVTEGGGEIGETEKRRGAGGGGERDERGTNRTVGCQRR